MLDAHTVEIVLVAHIVDKLAGCTHEQFRDWRQKCAFQGHQKVKTETKLKRSDGDGFRRKRSA